MSAFSNLKKNRAQALDKLSDELESVKKTGFDNSEADKYWKPTRDSQTGNGGAIIRFLMGDPNSDSDPSFVRYWDHSFKGPTGQWYIEKSRTTLGENDPVSEYNSKLWNSGDESKKEIASKQKRNLRYVANILVVKDPAHPENEGKVFLFRYGKKIQDKIEKMMKAEYEGDERINPFDLWEGVNFRLRVKTVANFPNYDDSEFDRNTSSVSDDDKELEEIWGKRYSLSEIVAPEAFKTYDELKAKLDLVLGVSDGSSRLSGGNGRANKELSFDDDDDTADSNYNLGNKFDDEDEIPSASAKEIASSKSSMDDDDDDMEYFQKLSSRK